MPSQFFYDNEIKNWLIQMIRFFSQYTVQYGLDNSGNQLYSTVPVIWGDGSFQAATIQKLNSENVMPNIPLMSLYISSLKYDRERMLDPTHIDTKQVRTRTWDANIGAYLPQQQAAYTVKRFMPAPYMLEVKLDIVTSNTQQKLQILEQILPIFNPSLEIQQTDNYLSWGSLSTLELTDVVWSNRSIPVGSGLDSSYDVATLSFKTPIYLSLPANVSKMGVIFKVITSLYGVNGEQLTEFVGADDLLLGTRQVVTFNNYGLFLMNNQLRILNQDALITYDSNIGTIDPGIVQSTPQNWLAILDKYGNIRPGITEIRLTYDNDCANEIVGTITVDPLDPTIVLYNIDPTTLPGNTLPSINGVVNPQMVAPGFGLPPASAGQSYLVNSNIGTEWPYYGSIIVNDITTEETDDDILLTELGNDITTEFWIIGGGTNANALFNDIITYNGNSWDITFAAIGNSSVQFVYDDSTNEQYQWNGNSWIRGYEGIYKNSQWRIIV